MFWTEDNFCFVSSCRNSFNYKLKKLINELVIIFYSLSNALCWPDESVQIKHLSSILSLARVPLVQSTNTEFLLIKKLWVLKLVSAIFYQIFIFSSNHSPSKIAVRQSKILGNNLGNVTYILIAIDSYFSFIYLREVLSI